MRYLRSYQYVFICPSWAVNLLHVSMCQMIPIVGFLVLLGYAFEVIEALHRHGDRSYPYFDFNRFAIYLARGWVPAVIYVPLLVLLGIFASTVWLALHESQFEASMMVPLLTLVALFYLILLVVGLLVVPLLLRTGLTAQLDLRAAMGFARNFLKLMWKEALLVWLFVLVTVQVLVLTGLLLCWLPFYPASVVSIFALHHLLYQLYELYLRRGGAPLPMQVEELV